jgi:predicted GNAT superfamily acetyltransferase
MTGSNFSQNLNLINQNMPQIITPKTDFEISQMIEICAQNLVENNRDKMSSDDFSNKGFLIGKLTKEDVQEMLANQDKHFVVAVKESENLQGYLTGCDLSESGIDFSLYVPNLNKIEGAKFFYHKQIVKRPEAKNVGSKLLLSMFDEAKARGYSHVICRIVHQPFLNQSSISFHEKFGFKKVGEMSENNNVLGIYLKELSHNDQRRK